MAASVDIWWTLGSHAEPVTAAPRARAPSAVPAEWRRGLRGRFLTDISRRCHEQRNWNAKGAARGWRFNLPAGQHLSLTDSGNCLIIGVGQGAPIGIDAERLRPVDDAASTLRRLHLPRLADALGQMAPKARQRAFAHVWTAFEAFLKLERLPWDAAAARFAGWQDKWGFEADGRARFGGPGVAFQSVDGIPEILLTVASPVPARISVREWGCDPIAMPRPNGRIQPVGELRRSKDLCR